MEFFRKFVNSSRIFHFPLFFRVNSSFFKKLARFLLNSLRRTENAPQKTKNRMAERAKLFRQVCVANFLILIAAVPKRAALEAIMNELSLFNSLFDTAFGGMPDSWKVTQMPKVDVKEGKDSYALQMDLPGCTEKDVNIEVDHGVLTISSAKTEEKEEKKDGEKWLIRERNSSRFTRRFTLPDDVDQEKISAVFKNGVLNVTMNRKELPAPKRIAIEAA